MSASAQPLGGPGRVRRSTLASRTASTALVVLIIAAVLRADDLHGHVVEQLTSLFIFMILAIMWNALAGLWRPRLGGQQAFIGMGAYATIYLTSTESHRSWR